MHQQITALSGVIAPHFYALHKSIKNHEFFEYWLKGGRGSTKSSFIAIEIILGIMKDPTANAICFRKVQNTLRDSVHTTLLWAIDALGVSGLFDAKVSPMEIIYRPTGQRIILRGLDEPAKVKSIKLRKGYFKFLWFEEASEFNGMGEIRSVEQSILRGGGDDAKIIEFFSYNPPNDPKNWINTEVKKPAKGKTSHHSTYLGVPKQWLGETFLRKAESLKENNFEAYRHEYLGEAVGNNQRIVFYGKYQVQDFETPSLDQIYQRRFFYGADWGFANDPNVLLRCFIKDRCLYIDHEATDKKYVEKDGVMVLEGAPCELDDLHTLFDKVPDSRKWKIWADSSRPETISLVKRQKFLILPVKKALKNKNPEEKTTQGKYVEDGIKYLLGRFKKIIVHSRCENLIVELGSYAYEVDKNTQEILPSLEDKYNHSIDALRYALSTYIFNKVTMFD